jgi:hypothetical protein
VGLPSGLLAPGSFLLNSLNSSRYSDLCPNVQVFLLPVIGLLIT